MQIQLVAITPPLLMTGRTRISTISRRPDGILHAVVDQGAQIELADADASIALEKILAAGERLPLLVDLGQVKSVSREARARFSDNGGETFLTAAALIIGSPISKLIGNFYLGFNKSEIPTRLFTSDVEALVWLKTFLP